MIPTTEAELARWRAKTDPLADDAIAALPTRPRRGEDVYALVMQGAKDGIAAHRAFVDAVTTVPPWADLSAMEPGRQWAMRHAPLTFLVLLAGSLVESFAAARGAVVLRATGRLEKDTLNRIYETASMVRDMFLPSSVAPGTKGHHAMVRVRLLHALVRQHLLRARFDTETLGQPVNQADMVHTLLLFSHVMVRGVLTLGGRITDDERASFLLLWRYAGYVLGVAPALLPRTLDEERALYELIRDTEYAPDDGSRSLAHAVLGALAHEPPFFLSKSALHEIARRLVGDALGDAFHLEHSRLTGRALDVLKGGVHTAERGQRLPFAPVVTLLAGYAFVESNRVRVLATSKPADFVLRIVPGARRRATGRDA